MSKELTKIILEIIELIEKNKLLDKNLSLIKKALDEKKENINTLIEIGIQCAQLKKIDEAQFIFMGISNFVKTDIRAYYNLGVIYSIKKDHIHAIEAYNCALKINPKDVETLINKGSVLNDLEQYQNALETLETAAKINPSFPETWSNLGIFGQIWEDLVKFGNIWSNLGMSG